jgi:hypothetical protein
MITFIINDTKINCKENETILELKNKIKEIFDIKVKYIDLDFKLEKTIRKMGKYNLESGILSRVMDNYTFEKFYLDGKEIHLDYIECPNYTPIIKKNIKSFNANKYMFDSSQNEIKYVKQKTFNLKSFLDFPNLG